MAGRLCISALPVRGTKAASVSLTLGLVLRGAVPGVARHECTASTKPLLGGGSLRSTARLPPRLHFLAETERDLSQHELGATERLPLLENVLFVPEVIPGHFTDQSEII